MDGPLKSDTRALSAFRPLYSTASFGLHEELIIPEELELSLDTSWLDSL